jgi:hypothetical protein
MGLHLIKHGENNIRVTTRIDDDSVVGIRTHYKYTVSLQYTDVKHLDDWFYAQDFLRPANSFVRDNLTRQNRGVKGCKRGFRSLA